MSFYVAENSLGSKKITNSITYTSPYFSNFLQFVTAPKKLISLDWKDSVNKSYRVKILRAYD